MAHALLAPSAAHRWMLCSAAPVMESKLPNETSTFAQEGTKAHELAASLLIGVGEPVSDLSDENKAHVQTYVDFVNNETNRFERRIELPLDISGITGEIGAKGTADCAACVDGTLKVIDLKFGMGVKVEAENNPQLSIYAIAAFDIFDLFEQINDVELIIVQPRLDHISRWKLTVPELKAIREEVKKAASVCYVAQELDANDKPIDPKYFFPSSDTCKFCRARGVCPSLAEDVSEVVTTVESEHMAIRPVEMFDNAKLAYALTHIDAIESWCKKAREVALQRIQEGQSIPGFKVVAGRKSARKWTDEPEAENTMKAMRLKVDLMYKKTLISPTTAQKLHKSGDLSDAKWAKLQDLISQSEGSPTLAPEDDPRPALPVLTQNDFPLLTE